MNILDYDFMRTAFAASGVVAVMAGVVGVFLVARGQTFAGHALSHVGFAGATAAGLSGALQMATGAFAAMLVGHGQDLDPSQYPMIWTMLGCGILSLLVFVLAAKFRTSRP